MFCPKCGSILFPKTVKGKKIIKCSCGYTDKKLDIPKITETTRQKEEVAVVDKEVEPYPLADAECPKCKHGKAYFWTVQTRASDEPETKFFKCEKCKYVWRDYN